MDKQTILVVKRDGSKEELNLDKIHNMLYKACDGLTGVSVSDIALQAKLSFYDGITSKEIHAALIKSAADLISETGINYQYVAGKLLNYDLRKTAWGGMNPPRLYDHVLKMVDAGYYTEELLEFYSEADFDRMDAMIDHDRDLKMTYIGLNEYITKYAIRDRSLKEVSPIETPQFTYMLVAAIGAYDTKAIKDIKSLYDDFSQWNVGLPTPIMAGLRSPTRQFSSCTKISCGDSLESISLTSDAIMKYAAKKAGIGIDATRIRAEGAPVGKEKAIKHTGVIPFLRAFEGALKSCSQGGVRGASATTNLLLWHLEVMDLMVLKNNKGTPDNRVRKLDYCFAVNDYLYNRLIDGKDITLFSPSEKETPGLYDAFFSDPKEFAKLYEKYEKDTSVRKKVVSAEELFVSLITERKETGRIYILNVDNVNQYSPFKKPITMTNLCLSGDTRISTTKGLLTLHELFVNGSEFSVSSDTRAYDGSEVLINPKSRRKINSDLKCSVEPSSPVYLTRDLANVFELELNNGYKVKATIDHKFMTSDGFKPLQDIDVGDYVYIQSGEGAFPKDYNLPTFHPSEYKNNKGHLFNTNLPDKWTTDLAFILGWLVGDGFITNDGIVSFVVGASDTTILPRIKSILNSWLSNHTIYEQEFYNSIQLRVHSKHFWEFLINLGLTSKHSHEKRIPDAIWIAPRDMQKEFIRALFGADGTVDISKNCQAVTISYNSVSEKLIDEVLILLSNFGIKGSKYTGAKRSLMLPDSNRNLKEYNTKTPFIIKIGKSNRNKFIEEIGFIIDHKTDKVIDSMRELQNRELVRSSRNGTYQESFMVPVKSITYIGEEPVYDITVENSHSFIANGIVTHNCVEINLPTVPMGTKKVEFVEVPAVEFVEWYNEVSKKHNLISVDVESRGSEVKASITTDESQIALCTLANINLGNVKNLDDLESVCRNAVRFLDNVLSYQDYMVVAAETHTKLYRPLGIGLTNLAYYLAKNNLKYSDQAAYELMHDTMEAISFYCIKASIELAKERGACEGYADTKWSDGILPIDRYKKTIDQIVPHRTNLDWEWLRGQLKEYGIRNATLLAMMPSESGSKVFNGTSGVDPVRSLITNKSNKNHMSKQVVPEYSRLKNRYDLLWEMTSMDGLIKMMAVIQKFTCQGISTNLSYNPEHWENGDIPMSVLMGDILKANYYSLKALYYNNLRDGTEDTKVEDAKEIISNETIEPAVEADDCDSCKI